MKIKTVHCPNCGGSQFVHSFLLLPDGTRINKEFICMSCGEHVIDTGTGVHLGKDGVLRAKETKSSDSEPE